MKKYSNNDKLVILVEHQSTINENMPLRMFIYIARVYEKIIENESIYKKDLIKIPKCEFFVLYNGSDNLLDKNDNQAKEKVLKLSDAFKEINNINLEFIVKVIDIRYNVNDAINKNNSLLKDYDYFIYLIEKYKENNNLNHAIKKAIKDCIDENILKEFLNNNSWDVFNMLTMEYNAEIEKNVLMREEKNYNLLK